MGTREGNIAACDEADMKSTGGLVRAKLRDRMTIISRDNENGSGF
jgi:hypothetical protein